MKWMTVRSGAKTLVGVVQDGGLRCTDGNSTLLQLVEAGPGVLQQVGEDLMRRPTSVVDLDEVTVLPPLRPPSIRDFLCFLEHMRRCRGVDTLDEIWTEIPGFYFSNVASLVGARDDIEVPPGTHQLDFELEVGAVVGVPGRDIARSDAWRHLAGLTIFCDWSARDIQLREMQLGLGPSKGKDFANTIGPMLVTMDELADRRDGNAIHLDMAAEVNDTRIGGGNLGQMDWTFDELVAHASRGTPLVAGDVLGSGTVPSGCLLEHFVTDPSSFPGWLDEGDIVRLTVEELGVIEQKIVTAREAA